MRTQQSGFAHIILVGAAVLVIVGMLVTVFVLRQLSTKDTQLNGQTSQDQPAPDNKGESVDKVTEQPVTTTKEPDTVASPAPAPVPQDALAPVVTPAPAPQSTTTPVTAANCSGKFTVYVSSPSGAPASYYPPSSWQTVTTHAYGTSLQAVCSSNPSISPEYVIINDAYVKSSQLSITKP